MASTDLAKQSSPPLRISGKVAKAIEAMVFGGLPRKEAAEHAGLSEHGLYKALRKPPVKAHYFRECEVLRSSGRARRIHRLEQLSEQDDNKQAAINAIRALDQLEDEAHVRANAVSQSSPGFVIMVVDQRAAVNAKPLIEHESSEQE